MPLNGQASGAWTESSSQLRLIHVSIRNTTCSLTDDAFTQTNPPIVTVAATVSTQVDTTRSGVLSGSVAFSRPDVGPLTVGGNAEGLSVAAYETLVKPLGLFINDANGYAWENPPATASNIGPYVSGQGTYASNLFESQALAAVGGLLQGDPIVYVTGVDLIASRNGYLMCRQALDGGALTSLDIGTIAAEVEHGHAASTTIAVLTMPADSTQDELVFDQRI